MSLEKYRGFRYNTRGRFRRITAAQWGAKPREWVTVKLPSEAKSDVFGLSDTDISIKLPAVTGGRALLFARAPETARGFSLLAWDRQARRAL